MALTLQPRVDAVVSVGAVASVDVVEGVGVGLGVEVAESDAIPV
jgi:hypothetical protein